MRDLAPLYTATLRELEDALNVSPPAGFASAWRVSAADIAAIELGGGQRDAECASDSMEERVQRGAEDGDL